MRRVRFWPSKQTNSDDSIANFCDHQYGDDMPTTDVIKGQNITLCFDVHGDALLSRDPFALITGMLLDQQMPMERAFLGPWRLAQRMDSTDALSIAKIASYEPIAFAELVSTPPAVHRFPAAMAARIQGVAQYIVAEYAGDTAALWRAVPSGEALYERIVRNALG